MYNLLLNSYVSDDFSLGYSEKYIPEDEDFKKRIIRFKTPSEKEINPIEIENFFRSYDHLDKIRGKSTRAMSEFYLEKFFEKIKNEWDFDDVKYIEGMPGSSQEKTNFLYKFFDNGRSIRVYDINKEHPVTEISRLVEIRKDETRHAIICIPSANRNPIIEPGKKIKAVKELLGRGYILSCMCTYSIDIFNKYISPKRKQFNFDPKHPSFIEKYLAFNQANLLLVYSATTPHLKRIGENVLERLRIDINQNEL